MKPGGPAVEPDGGPGRSETVTEPVTGADLPALIALARSVAWPHRPADLDVMLRIGQGRVIRGPDGGTQAVGLWWPCEPDAATLGMVIVAPAHQGAGHGRRLVAALLDDTAPRAVLLNATDAGRPLYDRLGFRPIGGVVQYQGDCTGAPVADARLRVAGRTDRDPIVDLDARAFGAARRGLLDQLLDAGHTLVLDRDGGIAGFAVRRRFGRGEVIGPVVAPDAETATSLIGALARPGFLRVDLPADVPELQRFLLALGLAKVSAPVTMVRGDWPARRGPARIFALAGHAFG